MDISNLQESWNGHTGAEVQTFVRNEISNVKRAISAQTTEVFTIENVSGTSEATIKERKHTIQLRVNLYTQDQDLNTQMQNTNVQIIVKKAASSFEDYSSTLDTIICRTNTVVDIVLDSYLINGYNYFQFSAKKIGQDTVTSNSAYFDVNVVDLRIVSATDTSIAYASDSTQLSFQYFIYGNITKIVQFEFGYYQNGTYRSHYVYNANNPNESLYCDIANEVSTETARSFTFDRNSLPNIFNPGIHVIKAKLIGYRDGGTRILESSVVETQYMIQTVSNDPMVIVNGVNKTLDNNTVVTFFRWSVYKNTESASELSEGIPVTFSLKQGSTGTEYATWTRTGTIGETYDLTVPLSINLGEAQESYLRMYIYCNGVESGAPISVTIRNNNSIAHISDAKVVFEPSLYDNGTIGQKIFNSSGNTPTAGVINYNTSTSVPNLISSVWENFDMTTDGYVNVLSDLEDSNSLQIKALKVPTDRYVEVEFNPFKILENQSATGSGLLNKNVTFEIDFRISNTVDYSEIPIQICNKAQAQSNNKVGLFIYPDKAVMLTADKQSAESQDAYFAEERRTRLTVNIVNDLRGTGCNYVRMFIDDVMYREFEYSNNDRFILSGAKLYIGAHGSDVEIFDIRYYEKQLSSKDVMQDYCASLPDNESKMAWKAKNDILDGNGVIGLQEAINAGYNVIGHTGYLPSYINNSSTKGQVQLYIHVNGDKKRCGTYVVKDGTNSTGIESKYQGTTSAEYFHWNQQYKIDKSASQWQPEYEDEFENYTNGYAIAEGEPIATKLVGKINFASSQQGHKMGLTRAYNDLFKYLVNQNKISCPTQIEKYPNARIAVYEKPFLFFHRMTEQDDWTFKYLMTFGPGKGDKKTFGYYESSDPEKDTSNMLMVEGADNEPVLALFQAPWMSHKITYNDEKWYYNGVKSINFGFGLDIIKDNGSGGKMSKIQDFFNFVYDHNTSVLDFYDGTYEDLAGVNSTANTSHIYFVTANSSAGSASGSRKYDLFRYEDGNWVYASRSLDLNNRYIKKNIASEYQAYMGSEIDESLSPEEKLAEFKYARRRHFKENASSYIHVDDALYHLCFIKFFAATDNRAKNTYYYTDPGDDCIRFMQDDLDTVIRSNNVGQNTKPYWIEEHDRDGSGNTYWQGENSGLYCMLEDAYEEEIVQMMHDMMDAMSTIVPGGIYEFMNKYILEAQNYFPAIAYNEVARLVYEDAKLAMKQGRYSHKIDPLSQNNGSQKWSEWQWLKDRIMYIGSFCEAIEFQTGSNSPGLNIGRGLSGTNTITLTALKYIYPRLSFAGSSYPVHDADVTYNENVNRKRLFPGNSASFVLQNISNADSSVQIKGYNYLSKFGDFNIQSSSSGEFEISGKALQEITINPNGTDANRLRVAGLRTSAFNIKKFIVRNVSFNDGQGFVNRIDLSMCTKLEEIDIRGCDTRAITIPSSGSLTSVKYSSAIQIVDLDIKCPKLSTVTIDGYSNITTFKFDQQKTPMLNIKPIIIGLRSNSANLQTLELRNVNWTGESGSITSNVLQYIASIENVVITGVINITDSLNFALKKLLIDKFGAIDDQSNSLYVTYPIVATSNVTISGKRIIQHGGNYTYTIEPSNSGANDFTGASFSVVDESNDEYMLSDLIMDESNNGVLHAIDSNMTTEDNIVKIKCSYQRLNNSPIVVYSGKIMASKRQPQPGDYVYKDGSYCPNTLNNGLPLSNDDVIGVCFYSNQDKDNPNENLRLMVAYKYVSKFNEIVSHNRCWGTTDVIDYITPQSRRQFVSLTANPVYDASVWNSTDAYPYEDNDTLEGDFGLIQFGTNFEQHLQQELMPYGQYLTLRTIQFRNNNLQQNGIIAPESDQVNSELANLHTAIVTNNATEEQAKLYFPPASACYAYQPNVANLDDKFKAHNWWLPSSGELLQLSKWFQSIKDGNSSDPFAVHLINNQGGMHRGIYGADNNTGGSFKLSSGGSIYHYSSSQQDQTYVYASQIRDFKRYNNSGTGVTKNNAGGAVTNMLAVPITKF